MIKIQVSTDNMAEMRAVISVLDPLLKAGALLKGGQEPSEKNSRIKCWVNLKKTDGFMLKYRSKY